MKIYLSGARAWLLQRAMAVYLLAFILYFIFRCLVAPPVSYEAWRDWMLSPGQRLASLLFFLAVTLHAWVGLRDVVLDYVKPFVARLAVLAVIAGGLVVTLVWAALVLSGGVIA